MEVKPGSEMIAAIDAAEELGIEIALVDRDIRITLQRFIGKLGFFEKIKMVGALVGALFGVGGKDIDIESITEEDIVTQLVSELKEFSPTTASVLIEERDAYIAKNLLDLKEKGTGNVVAIVGAGHRKGIQEYLKHPEKLPDINKLLEIPKETVQSREDYRSWHDRAGPCDVCADHHDPIVRSVSCRIRILVRHQWRVKRAWRHACPRAYLLGIDSIQCCMAHLVKPDDRRGLVCRRSRVKDAKTISTRHSRHF